MMMMGYHGYISGKSMMMVIFSVCYWSISIGIGSIGIGSIGIGSSSSSRSMLMVNAFWVASPVIRHNVKLKGVLTEGIPLDWKDSVSELEYVRQSGVQQFLSTYKRVKDCKGDELLWGDEVEYGIFHIDDKKSIRLSLRASQVRSTKTMYYCNYIITVLSIYMYMYMCMCMCMYMHITCNYL